MRRVSLHDKEEIAQFLYKHPFLHIYSLGDLDDFFWQDTIWFGLRTQESLSAVVLLYTGFTPPILQALSPPEHVSELKRLVSECLPLFPPEMYVHISPGILKFLSRYYNLRSHGLHLKFALTSPEKNEEIESFRVIPLSISDSDNLQSLFDISYPDHAFDPNMLQLHPFYGIRQQDEIISVAGFHVYSQEYQVAALGNVTTHPSFRGQGYGKIVSAKMCSVFQKSVEYIGLNVKASNSFAIRIYQKLGFEEIGRYYEMSATK